MQILSTARCLRRIEKTAFLHHPFTSSYLSWERTIYPLPRAVLSFFSFSALPGPHSRASFSRGNHPGDRAETHRNYCLTKLINYAGMDLGAEKRAFFGRACCQHFYLVRFFSRSPPVPLFVVNPTGGALSFYLAISSPDLLYPRLFFGWVRDRLIFFHFQCETKLFTKNISVLLALTLLYDIWQVLFIYQIHSGILLALHSSNLMYPKEIISPILFALFIYRIYLSDISFCVTKIVNAAVLFGLKSCVWEVQTASIIFVIFRRGRKEREGRRDVDKARWEAVPRKCA